MPVDIVNRIFLDILEDSLAVGLKPLPGAVDVIQDMARAGSVTVITARHLKQPLIDWFEEFFTTQAQQAINLVVMGNHDDKLRYVLEHNLKYFVDDRAETCRKLAEADITPLVFNQPWNRNRHTLQSVSSWQEIRAMLALPN